MRHQGNRRFATRPWILLALASSGAAQVQVHVVDVGNGAGSEFTTLTAAVAAAAPGDVLLVRGGQYPEALVLDGKGLSVMAEPGARVGLARLEVANLAVDQTVALRGLDLRGAAPGLFRSNAGALWLEDCRFETELAGGPPALLVEDSGRVALHRCQLLGPSPASGTAQPALRAVPGPVFPTRLHVHQSELSARGPAAGMELVGSFLELFGSHARGGDGAPGTPTACAGEDGGAGLVLEASTAHLRDSVLEGGAGGAGDGACADGDPGAPLVTLAGSGASTIAGAAGRVEVNCPVREDELFTITLTGRPGDMTWLLYSPAPGPPYSSRSFDGEFHLDTGRVVARHLGTVPASGTLVVRLPAFALPAGTQAETFALQPLFRDAVTGRYSFGAPCPFVLLDESF